MLRLYEVYYILKEQEIVNESFTLFKNRHSKILIFYILLSQDKVGWNVDINMLINDYMLLCVI